MKVIHKPVLQLQEKFWTVVRDLAPAGAEKKTARAAGPRVPDQGKSKP